MQNPAFCSEIDRLKKITLTKLSAGKTDSNSKTTESVRDEQNSSEIKMGAMVHLVIDPKIKGAVIGISVEEDENVFTVFHDGKPQTYFESQIRLDSEDDSPKSKDFDYIKAVISANILAKPGNEQIYSLFSSRINFEPHQFRPIRKLINNERPRMLIADEVGVGKTIEAGLVLKELQARQDIQSVLIICPKALVDDKKWVREMQRFDEKFQHLDRSRLNYCIEEYDNDGVWPRNYQKSSFLFLF